jgi:ABC-type Na+ efflux pump permease subunit
LVDVLAVLVPYGAASDEAGLAGPRSLRLLAICQLAAVLVVTPAVTRRSITRERHDGTWELLLASRASSVQIVWGKLVAVVVFTSWLVIASLPFFGVVFLFSGVSWPEVASSWLLSLDAAILIGAATIFVSAVPSRSKFAVFALLCLPWIVGLPTYAALQSAFPPVVRVSALSWWPPWQLFTLLSLAVTCALVATTALRLRPSARRIEQGAA